MSPRARIWAVALGALCLAAGACAAISLATPPRRACRHARADRCSHIHRRPRHHHAARTPAQPAGSAGQAHPNASTTSGSSSPSAAGAPAAGGATGPAEPAGESPAPGSSGPPPPARVQVIAKEYSLTLSRPEVPAGEVIVELLNRGEDAHNLHLLEPVEGSEAGSLPNTEPGALHDLKLTLRAGSFTLFCSMPGHEAKGMKATLIVR
jgi:hypothetical protein